MTEGSPFDPMAFLQERRTREMGKYVVYRETVGSTMDVARGRAEEGAPHGTLVLAEEQTAGRGRKGRTFFSPPHQNLYFTLILRTPGEVNRRLPVIVPVAVCEAIRHFVPSAAIKWPNDIWIGERKACGMLIDAELTGEGALAFPGIGINVNGDPTLEPELRDIATSLAREAGRTVSREQLLAAICNVLEALLEAPPGDIIDRYRELSCILGRQVTVHPTGGEPFSGVATGIGDSGDLCVERPDGTAEWVTAADVTVRPQPPPE